MPTFLRITAKRAGFRRAGIEHLATEVEHPIDAFTVDQVETLKNEPMLTVVEIEISETPSKGSPPAASPAVSLSITPNDTSTDAPAVDSAHPESAREGSGPAADVQPAPAASAAGKATKATAKKPA